MTRDQYREFWNSRHATAGTTQARTYKGLFRSTPPVGKSLSMSADPQYELILIADSPGGTPSCLGGMGVGERGDYVLVNEENWDELYGYRNGREKCLASGVGYDGLAGGRMLGHYYFGDWGGDLFRLEHDRKITSLGGPEDSSLEVGAVAIEPVRGDVYFAVNDYNDYPDYGEMDLFRYSPSRDRFYFIGALDYEYCWGLAIKGNFLYMSLAYDNVILKWNYKKDSRLIQFTNKVDFPQDIQFDTEGNLYVAEYCRGDIIRFNATATKWTRIAWNLFLPVYIGLDRAGDIFFQTYTSHLSFNGYVYELKKKS